MRLISRLQLQLLPLSIVPYITYFRQTRGLTSGMTVVYSPRGHTGEEESLPWQRGCLSRHPLTVSLQSCRRYQCHSCTCGAKTRGIL